MQSREIDINYSSDGAIIHLTSLRMYVLYVHTHMGSVQQKIYHHNCRGYVLLPLYGHEGMNSCGLGEILRCMPN